MSKYEMLFIRHLGINRFHFELLTFSNNQNRNCLLGDPGVPGWAPPPAGLNPGWIPPSHAPFPGYPPMEMASDSAPPPPYAYPVAGNPSLVPNEEKNQNQFNIPPDNLGMGSPTSSNDSSPAKTLNTNDNLKVNLRRF